MKQDFVTWMTDKALKLRADAAANGERHDGGAQRILDVLAAYNIGNSGLHATFIPSLFSYLDDYNTETDSDWVEFQRLADKFGVQV